MSTPPTTAPATRSEDEAQIRDLLATKEAAMRARDAALLVSRFGPDAVTFTLAPPLQHAGPQVSDPSGFQGWFAGFDGPIDYEIRDLSVTVGDDVAFGHSLDRLTATPHGDVESFTLWARTTVGLRKIDGRWQITHEHNSTPFYMDGSFQAAVDLQP